MISKVSNISELRAEQSRLRQKRDSLEGEIKNDFEKIKQDINPFHFLKSKATEIKSRENGIANELLGASLPLVLDFLITRVFFKKSGFLKKVLLSVLIQFAGSKMLAGNSEAILAVIKDFIGKLKKDDADKSQTYDRTTAADEY